MPEIPSDIWEDCPHKEYRKEYRTRDAYNLPTYCYNAVFPGDEAGYNCKMSGCACDDIPSFEECERFKRLDDDCPADMSSGDNYEPCGEGLYRDSETGNVYCEECGIAEVD